MCSISPRCLPPFSIWVPESVSKGFGFGKGSQMFQTDSNMQNQSAFLSHWFSLTPLTLGQVHQLHQPSFRTCFEHIKWRLCCKSFKGSSTVTLYKAAWRSQGVKETKGSENHSVKLSNSLINFFVCLWLHADTQCQYSDGTSPIVVQDSCNSNGNWSATGSTTSHTKPRGVRGLGGLQQCMALLELHGLLWTSSRLWTPATWTSVSSVSASAISAQSHVMSHWQISSSPSPPSQSTNVDMSLSDRLRDLALKKS